MVWHLVADSACDLNTLDGGEGKIDFATIPFSIRIGGKEYIDDDHMQIEEMLAAGTSRRAPAVFSFPFA